MDLHTFGRNSPANNCAYICPSTSINIKQWTKHTTTPKTYSKCRNRDAEIGLQLMGHKTKVNLVSSQLIPNIYNTFKHVLKCRCTSSQTNNRCRRQAFVPHWSKVTRWRSSRPIGSRALSFSGPLLSLSVNVCLCVRNFEVKYLGNQRS